MSARVHDAACGYRQDTMAHGDPRMVALGYGKYVRAGRIFALIPR